jgi:hypothetical protein
MAGGAVFKLGSFGNFGVFNQRDAGPHFLTTDGHGRRATEWVMRANWGRRHAVLPIWFIGIFRRGGGGDGHDRSFITRDFKRVWGKENGTIPF